MSWQQSMENNKSNIPLKMSAEHDSSKEEFMFKLEEEEMEEEVEGRCGFRSCEPKLLQSFNSIRWMVLFMCIFSFVEGFIANGIINVIILALEVRYQLSSKESGLIVSGNDFGSFIVLLFIGHFAEGRHKPKIMAVGVLSMALGSFIFALPHFVGQPYSYIKTDTTSAGQDNVCDAENNSTTNVTGDGAMFIQQESSFLYFLFLLGQICLGIGSCPMFTIGLTYIDESSKPKMTSFYTGLVMCSAALGVAAGYIAAGHTLAIYVDIDKVDVSSIDLTPMDPRWVGAWWIGVVISFFAFLVIALPFFAYPKRLPGYNVLMRSRKSEAHGDVSTEISNGEYKDKFKDYPKAVFRLLQNQTFVLLCLAGCCEALIIAGTASFGAKILQQFFFVDVVKAGMIMGIITIPGAGGGIILGGCLVKKFNLKCIGIIKLCAIATFLSLLLAPSFLTRCDETPIAGVTAPYHGVSKNQSLSLEAECNNGCRCTTHGMEPLCLGHQVTYFSPCHAGCSAKLVNNIWDLNHCKCTKILAINSSTIGMAVHYLPPGKGNGTQQTASITNDIPDEGQESLLVPGSCSKECWKIYVFCVMFMFIMLFTFSTLTPNVTAVMRCVRHDERSLAVGLQTLVLRIMGTTPGPVLFGALFDSSCLTWQYENSRHGTCWIYDLPAMVIKIIVWWVIIKLTSLLIYCLAIYVYKPPVAAEAKSGTKALVVD